VSRLQHGFDPPPTCALKFDGRMRACATALPYSYAMRVREWYGWHFPEMTKIVGDNIAYAKVRLKGGTFAC
jgi:hypothetical protein